MHSFGKHFQIKVKWCRNNLVWVCLCLLSCLITKTSASYSQLEYNSVPLLYGMVLEVTVKNKSKNKNKTFVAAVNIKLDEELVDKEKWFPLGNCAI